jgi:gamma-glutamyltranspeptidase/glutathione hydrolase
MIGVDRRQFLAATGAAVVPNLLRADTPIGRVNGQPQAAEAGMAVLAAGGNAVDAVVAAALVAGVVAVPSTGIGGYGGHMVIAKPDGKVSAIDFNTVAPAAARPDMFPLDEKEAVKGRLNDHGWLAAGVPGVLAGLQLALDKFGTRKFTDLAKPAIKYARDGFPISKALASAIQRTREQFAKDPGSAKLFLNPKGEAPRDGATFRNADLGDLLQRLADKGRVDDFYTGDIAKQIAAAFQKNGGLVTADDLATYRAVEVTPLALEWRGHTIFTPPPSAGGLTALQALATLKTLGWAEDKPTDPAGVQARVEALRLAWDDRLRLVGDPKHANVPIVRLLSDEYAKERAAKVRAALAAKKPVDARSDGRPAGGTINLNAVDSSGMMVALTFTHGNGFGAQVTVDGLGLILGHGMSRFEPRPGHPNSVGPGKRPLHNMCPAAVLKGQTPMLALGATGGRKIPNTVFDMLAYRIGEGKPLAEAIKAPRVHTEGDLNLQLEATWPAAVVDRFKEVGYVVKVGTGATASAIERDEAGKVTAAFR